MEKLWVKKIGIVISSLMLIAFLGVGCATDEQMKEIRTNREAAETAMKAAQDAATRAQDAATRAEKAAEKCEKAFEKGLRK